MYAEKKAGCQWWKQCMFMTLDNNNKARYNKMFVSWFGCVTFSCKPVSECKDKQIINFVISKNIIVNYHFLTAWLNCLPSGALLK